MAVVKGSKQHRVKVVYDKPVLRWVIRVGVFSVLIIVAISSYQLGHSFGMGEQEKALNDVSELKALLGESKSRVRELEQTIHNSEMGAEVDRLANEEVRQEVIALKKQLAKLEEDNSFYRGLMEPNKKNRGLIIGEVEISATDRPRAYRYKIMLKQLATNHQVLTGALKVTVVGREQGTAMSYNLGQISDKEKKDSVKLRFKYFQAVEGEMLLPEGFDADTIDIVASSIGKNAVTVTKQLSWSPILSVTKL